MRYISFESDYVEGCHEKILQRLCETNREQLPGYGTDKYTAQAKEKIRAACESPKAGVYFLAGGTQSNLTVISTLLDSHEGVLAADTGHINGHEAGAIEYSGHKVLPLPHSEGKVRAPDVEEYLSAFWRDENHEHMVHPGMVYISHPTEYGTLYTREELEALSRVCRAHGIPLFLDGARLGYGLMAPDSDLTLPLVASYCDVFTIGGTKVGALCGEALIFSPAVDPKGMLPKIKQRGALLAKGRLLGIQFDTLFTDGLYFEISRHAIRMAALLREVLRQAGLPFYISTTTNQIFVILENERMRALSERVGFSYWEAYDSTHTVVRFATSWATTEENIAALSTLLAAD